MEVYKDAHRLVEKERYKTASKHNFKKYNVVIYSGFMGKPRRSI